MAAGVSFGARTGPSSISSCSLEEAVYLLISRFLTLFAANEMTEECGSALFALDPRPLFPRRIMSHVPCVSALQVRDPIAVLVEMKPGDALLRHVGQLSPSRYP